MGLYDQDSYLTYYRIDFYKSGNFIPVLRNHQYKISINSVTVRGKSTKELAFSSGPNMIGPQPIIFSEESSSSSSSSTGLTASIDFRDINE